MAESQAAQSFWQAEPGSTELGSGEAEFRRLLERLPAAAYTCAPDGKITYYNRRAVELWGRAPKLNDPTDRFCGSLRLFDTNGTPLRHDGCWMALALETDREYDSQEIVIERPDGRRLTVLAHASPLHDESGSLTGAVNVLVDITDRKRAEEALRSADEAKDEFLATLAHELRNPLAPVRNAVEVLRLLGPQTAELRWALELIERQMRQMTRLIDDLLDVSRVTLNKLRLRRERLDLQEVVQAALESTQPRIEAGQHELSVEVGAEPMPIDGDPVRLAQALANLIDNAAKYTDSGGRIEVEVTRRGREAWIAVRDNGIGISAEMLPRIFELFVQGERTGERMQDGLGIGLTLSRRLVEMHGGCIEARSEGTGLGSEFVVRLPLAADREGLTGLGQGTRVALGRPLHVLVVDDNRDAAESLSVLLREAGHHTSCAYDGLEALAAADADRPDVVVLDIGLPRLDGYETARRLRGESWGRRAVIVALTGWGQESDKKRARAAGFDHHLVKPVEPAKLLELIASVAPRPRDPRAQLAGRTPAGRT